MFDRTRAFAVAAGTAFAALGCGNAGGSAPADWQTFSSQRQHAGEERLQANVEYAAGRFAVEPGGESSLYGIDMRYDANVYRPDVTYDAGRLNFRLEGSGSVRGRNLGDGHLRITLNPMVDTDLNLQFGAVRVELELGGMSLRNVSVQTGASETRLTVSQPNRVIADRVRLEAGAASFSAQGLGNLNARSLNVGGGVGNITLDFTGAWETDAEARIDVGVGALNLRFPRGLGVRIDRSGALSGFDGQELVRRGNSYYSADWDAAPRKLHITMNAAIGRVRVAWVDDAPIS
jgi:hypothetical protein